MEIHDGNTRGKVFLRHIAKGELCRDDADRILMRAHPTNYKPYDGQNHYRRICVVDMSNGSTWFLYEGTKVTPVKATLVVGGEQ